MEIKLTKEQYENLLKLVFMGSWMANAFRVKDTVKKFEELEDYIYSFAKDFGLENYVEYDEKFKKYFITREFEEDPELRQYMDEYTNDTFWDELICKLTSRDMLKEYGEEEVKNMDFLEYNKKESKFMEKYDDEFRKNGITNIEVVQQVKKNINGVKDFKGKFKDNGLCECGMCGKTSKYAGLLNPMSTDPLNPPVIACIDCMATIQAKEKGITKQEVLKQRKKMFDTIRIFQEVMMARYLQACSKKDFNTVDEANKAIGIAMNHWNSLSRETRISFDNYEESKLKELFQKMDIDFTKDASTFVPQTSKTIGRNDPCPCGSGKKYKKCCLLKVS